MKNMMRLSALWLGMAFLLTSCTSPLFWRIPRPADSSPSESNTESNTVTSSEEGASSGNGETGTSATTQGESISSSDSTESPGTDSAVSSSGSTVSAGTGSRSSSTAKTTTSAKTTSTVRTTTTTTKPAAPAEFRGVWLSYLELNNLLSGKSVAAAKSAIDTVMNNVKSYGLNAVIFHVRANSDAYYQSSVFNAASSVKSLLNSGFDPLAYAVESAHKRGLQLHAWINPYRVGTTTSSAKVNDYFLSGGRYYYNPSAAEVQSLIIRGVEEVVKNYDVDGVQFDDYFYPADTTVVPANSPAAFEKAAYTAYTGGGGKMSIGDWRRTQVSSLVRGVYNKVHAVRKACVFGISPGAVISKNHDAYYADVATWMANAGYVDYLCPQVYFGFLNQSQPFETNVSGWASAARHSSVRLYIGLALYKTGVSPDSNAGTGKQEWVTYSDIMKRSVMYLRTKSACSGMIFYRYDSFLSATRTAAAGQTYSAAIGAKEVSNVLSVLK